MFIIFDLDDTLVDTSAFIAPHQLKKSLAFAEKRGLKFDEPSKKCLFQEHVRAPSSEMALKEFLEGYGATSSLILEVLQEYRTLPGPTCEIPAVPHALEVLEVLKALEEHRLAVVTIGREEMQHYKLKKAGFFADFFSKIIVTTEKNKKIHYKALLEEYNHSPEETLVVGDRIEADLVPAKELGCCTVRLLRGRGAYEPERKKMVDHSIQDLRELLGIIQNGNK